jgi:hypothetical protein
MVSLSSLQTNQKNVSMLCFSIDGRLLVSVGDDKKVVVSEWRSQTVLCSIAGEALITQHIVASSVNDNSNNSNSNNNNNSLSTTTSTNFTFLTCGDKHIRFWTLNGRNLNSSKVLTTTNNKDCVLQMFLCCVVIENGKVFLIGCEDGSIYVVFECSKGVQSVFKHNVYLENNTNNVNYNNDSNEQGNKKNDTKTNKNNKKNIKNTISCPAVTAMHVNNEKKLLFTGARDGTIVIWDFSSLLKLNNNKETLKLTNKDIKNWFSIVEINGLENIIFAKQIQSIYMLNNNDSYNNEKQKDEKKIVIVVATRGCDIFELDCKLDTYPKRGSVSLLTNKNFISDSNNSDNDNNNYDDDGGEDETKINNENKVNNKINVLDDGIINRSHCNDELWFVIIFYCYDLLLYLLLLLK